MRWLGGAGDEEVGTGVTATAPDFSENDVPADTLAVTVSFKSLSGTRVLK